MELVLEEGLVEDDEKKIVADLICHPFKGNFIKSLK